MVWFIVVNPSKRQYWSRTVCHYWELHSIRAYCKMVRPIYMGFKIMSKNTFAFPFNGKVCQWILCLFSSVLGLTECVTRFVSLQTWKQKHISKTSLNIKSFWSYFVLVCFVIQIIFNQIMQHRWKFFYQHNIIKTASAVLNIFS